ncbi:hypothetical protein [Roseomonas sp. BN140053]|uniref:hypothetical protein n=1 Tax=Roseomonas sp. BN140053 TaxID=3391898 RepID=UPI0039EB76E5
MAADPAVFPATPRRDGSGWRRATVAALLAALLSGAAWAPPALAQPVLTGDAGFVWTASGAQPIPFLYLGAKQLLLSAAPWLFLLAALFLRPRPREIGRALLLLLGGALLGLLLGQRVPGPLSPELPKLLAGLAVAWMALGNLGAWRRWFGLADGVLPVLVFGLAQGLWLTAVPEGFVPAPLGRTANLLAMQLGGLLGLLLATAVTALLLAHWRRAGLRRHGYLANLVLLTLGFVLSGDGLVGALFS